MVSANEIMGNQTHDARFVAVMRIHLVSTILTFNGAHFELFPGISVLARLRSKD